MKHVRRSLALILLTISGCGGGGGGSDSTVQGQGPQTITAGTMSLQGQSMHQPLVAAGQRATVYSVSGNISKATLYDLSPRLEETEIAYVLEPAGVASQLRICAPDGSSDRALTTIAGSPGRISFLPGGTYVYYLEGTDLKRIPIAGGIPSLVAPNISGFCFTPSGTRLVYLNTSGELNVSTITAGSPMLMTTFTGWTQVSLVGCSAEDELIFAGKTTPAEARSPRMIQLVSGNPPYSSMSTLAFGAGALSADPRYFEWIADSGGGTGTVHRTGLQKVGSTFPDFVLATISVPTDVPSTLDVSPDGTTFLSTYYQPGVNPQRLQLVLHPYSMGAWVAQGRITQAAWGPFRKSTVIVGGAPVTSAAAVFYAEDGPRLASVVVADVTTRNTIAVTEVSSATASNVVFKVTGDQITKLYYSDSNYLPLKAIINWNSGLTGAFVSFDSQTGKVTSVATFLTAPSLRPTGQTYELSGGSGIKLYDLHNGKSMRPVFNLK